MDKETLSNYGWITICCLILAVMIALSTPFGDFVAVGVKSTTAGLFDTNQTALNTTGLVSIDDQNFDDGTIPLGGTYTTSKGTVLSGNSNDSFPDTPATGDIYEYGDYIYTYNKGVDYGTEWSVKVKDKTKSSYGKILSEIAGKPITNMYGTFVNCHSLTIAPEIPDGVTNMKEAFYFCQLLTTTPTIPSSVTNIQEIFCNCTSLITYVGSTDADGDFSNYKIPKNITDMYQVFAGCKSLTTAPTIPNNVTSMKYTFESCTSLTITPVIPNSVTNMRGAFHYCTSLTTAPQIPSSVTDMYGTFQDCTSLTTAPAIPNSVTNLSFTFKGCTSLTTAPTIPSRVIDMRSTFFGCTSLTGTITINVSSNLIYYGSYNDCFYLSSIGKNITFKGTASKTTLQSLANTSSAGKRIVYDINGNILKQ